MNRNFSKRARRNNNDGFGRIVLITNDNKLQKMKGSLGSSGRLKMDIHFDIEYMRFQN